MLHTHHAYNNNNNNNNNNNTIYTINTLTAVTLGGASTEAGMDHVNIHNGLTCKLLSSTKMC